MSGGVYEYIACKINDGIDDMQDLQDEEPQEYREIAIKISKAYSDLIRTIEWADSGDVGSKEALEAINVFLKEIHKLG
jgi:hypothetical protein